MYASPSIHEQYRQRHHSNVTVQSNDVAFAVHAFLLASITLLQIAYYGRSVRPSRHIGSIMAIILLMLLVFMIGMLLIGGKTFSTLNFLYLLSYVKVLVTLIKYIPQVVLNYQRQSTVGWSIWQILLDFGGGVLSTSQLVLDCANLGDFTGITGNMAKFCLGFVSIVFDIIFIVQHYILYPLPTNNIEVVEVEPMMITPDNLEDANLENEENEHVLGS
jgi:cystinosin